MKKLKVFVFLALVALVTPLFFGCGEATFESTPWVASESSVAETIAKLDEAKEFLHDVGLPVKFSTVTTYDLSKRLDDSGKNVIVREETTTTLYYKSREPNLAEVKTKRSIGSETLSEVTTLYDNDEGKVYTTSKSFSGEDETTTYRVATYSKVDMTFNKILSQTIYTAKESALTSVNQKTFNDINYYQLVSSSVSPESGLAVLNDEFAESATLYDDPKLYQVFDKKHDYVLNYSAEFGVDGSGYLDYFAFNYSVSHSNDTRPGERSVYLKVSSTTRLDEYGQDLEAPSEVSDKNFYLANTFVDTVRISGTYVSYRDSLSSSYNFVTAYKATDGIFVRTTVYENGIAKGDSKTYFYKKSGSGYDMFELNIREQKYSLTTYEPLLLLFDYSRPFYTKRNNDYMFGTSEKYTKLNIRDGEIYSVGIKDSTDWYVTNYGVGMGEFINVNIDDYTFV